MDAQNNTSTMAITRRKAASTKVGYDLSPSGETSTNWLTPPEITEALGPFDLDPASPEVGMPGRVTATRMIGPSADGLKGPWPSEDFVFLSPPAGRGIGRWLKKAADHGNGLTLIYNRSDTRYFFDCIWRHKNVTAIFMFDRRLKFRDENGNVVGSAGASSMLVAYGAKARLRLIQALENRKLYGRFVDLNEAQTPYWQLGRREPKLKKPVVLHRVRNSYCARNQHGARQVS